MISFTKLLLFYRLFMVIDINHAFVIQQVSSSYLLDKLVTQSRVGTSLSFWSERTNPNVRGRSKWIFAGISGGLKRNFHELILEELVNSQKNSNLLKPGILIDGKSESTSESTSDSLSHTTKRRVTKLQIFERIPAWPLKNGIHMNSVARLPGGKKIASRLEDRFGGRTCPNIFVNTDDISKTSPFLMLVHHNHSFDLFDPARWIERSVIPEGFPSHAHRGMITITICLKGGLIHRDSLGIKQVFGGDEKGKYQGKHTQALNFGAGVIHELMWDNAPSRIGQQVIRQEIYQIWVDVPSDQRMSDITVDLLGGDHETPTLIESKGSELESKTVVIAGSHKSYKSTMTQKSDFTILQVSVEPGKTWSHSSPLSFQSMVIYMRSGCAKIQGTVVPKHGTSFCSNNGEELVLVADEKMGADFLLLAGQPLHQDVIARGSVVGESHQDIANFRKDCEENKMGKTWDETLTDEQWKMHVQHHPCTYKLE